MARVSPNNITSLSTDWGNDPLNGMPFSGAAVQAFIKSYLGAVAKASYFDPTNNTMYWFATDDDKTAFIANPTLTNLVLFSTTLSFSSELYRISLTNNNNTTSINVATNEEHVYLNIDFDVQTKSINESSWRSTGKGVYVSVQVDAGSYGEWTTVMNPTFYAAGTNFNFDAREYIVIGQNRVKVNFVQEDDDSVVASITYTIAMTEMFIEPLDNQWYKPIVETGDVANYKLGGFRIIGAVNKTLHLDIYNGEDKLLSFTENIGTTAYDRVPYYFTKSDGLDLSSLESGVYLVSAYLTSGSLTSAPVNYNIIYIATGDETTAQFVAVNDPADVVFNYTTSTLFKYTLYNKGTLTASPAVVVKEIQGTTPTVIVNTTINDVSTGEEHSYDVALEWITEETLNLYVQGEITFGNQQIVRAVLDNSATFPPTPNFDFYLNAASRTNNDTNKTKIINSVNHAELTPTWTNMVWIDGIDGWTVDDTNRQCLYLPARSKMVLPYNQYKILNGENISIEFCYRIANVTDYNEIAMAIMDNLNSLGFTGIRIKPSNITVHSSLDTSDVNDLIRGTNVKDDEVVHFVLTVYPNFMGNTNRNLVTGYINGCKNFQFDYDTGAVWNVNANLQIGCERSDISLYFIRVYRSVLSDAAVQANYINSLNTITARTEMDELLSSCMDDSNTSIKFENVKNNNYNYFIIEMLNGASLPSRKNGWDKSQTGLSNLEMHFGQHPDWDWRIEGVETAGQGTTSMNYYLWNLRWRIDKSNGDDKKVYMQYLESRTIRQGSYQYSWYDKTYSKTLKFDGTQHPQLKRMTAKINFASSMQSHKIGATRAYTDLHNQVGLTNEAQTYAANNSLPKPTVAVYQYPCFGFQKIGNTYEFIGLFTIGPDKGDKPTFGYDITSSIKEELITMEGTDHSRKMVMFNYPWNSDVEYLASNECINIVKGTSDYDNGWEVGNCHDLSTDDAADQAAIETILETEFKPAYEIAYLNSTLLLAIPLGTYGATAAATLTYINNNIATFQSLLDSDNRMTYANYQFWIEDEYKVYYYDIKDGIYKWNGQNLVTQCGQPTGSTLDEKNEYFKSFRRAAFMASAENYWDIQDTLFHYCLIVMIGAMDNFGKNTYPYKMATLAHGGRWKWRQDDLDSIFGIGNAGADNMPTWMEFADSQNGSVYFGGSTSVFWNLINECYYNDYVSTVTGSTTGGIVTMGKNIMEAMSSLAGGTNVYDGVIKFCNRYFWNNAQNYFPQSAYDADASLKYEAAWLANGQEVPPLTQSLGNHYTAEQLWVNIRMIYMMSLFKAGAFGSYADTSLGQIAFRPQSLQSLTVKPLRYLYPAFASGQGMVTTGRTADGQPHTFVGPFGTDGQTTHYINGADLLIDLGDWKDLRLGAQYTNSIQIQGKKLIKFKIGDETAVNVTTNVPGLSFDNTYCLEEIDARNAQSLTQSVDLSVCRRLKKAYFEGTSLSQVRLQNGSKIEELHLPDSTTIIQLRNLKKLTDANLVLPSDLSNITQLQVLNCDIDTLGMLYDIYETDDNSLGYFNIAMLIPKSVGMDYLNMIVNIKQNKDKDGNIVENGYHGISPDGQTLDTANPTIDGTFLLTDGFYQQDIDALELTNIQPYPLDNTKNIGLIPYFSALYAVYDPTKIYIRFADPAVASVILAHLGDGTGVTMTQIQACTSILNWFYGNTDIVSFDELGYFTGITSWNGSNGSATFQNCTSLEKVAIPKSLGNATYTFNGCTALEEIKFLVPHTAGNYRYTGCSSLTKIYFNTLDDFLNSDFGVYNTNTNKQGPFDVSLEGHVYINNIELTNLVIPSGRTTFPRCSFLKNLESVEFPSSLTTIPNDAFRDCSKITGTLVIPSTVTSIGKDIVNGCNLNVLKIDSNTTCSFQAAQGDNFKTDSTFITKGSLDKDTNGTLILGWDNIIIHGDLKMISGYPANYSNKTKIFRIKGDYLGSTANVGLVFAASGGVQLKFIELMGTVGNARLVYNNLSSNTNGTRCATGDYWHFGSSSVIPADRVNQQTQHWNKTNMVWVGDGSSRANDEAVLALYLADAAWSAYPSKLSTWYDYNGQYKWYYVTDNLTNCVNTNPDEWPHITRKESYRTTIRPDEGKTITSVTVQMYQASDDGATPSTPTTLSNVYNQTTGEIYIASVVGNIIITATAS